MNYLFYIQAMSSEFNTEIDICTLKQVSLSRAAYTCQAARRLALGSANQLLTTLLFPRCFLLTLKKITLRSFSRLPCTHLLRCLANWPALVLRLDFFFSISEFTFQFNENQILLQSMCRQPKYHHG